MTKIEIEQTLKGGEAIPPELQMAINVVRGHAQTNNPQVPRLLNAHHLSARLNRALPLSSSEREHLAKIFHLTAGETTVLHLLLHLLCPDFVVSATIPLEQSADTLPATLEKEVAHV